MKHKKLVITSDCRYVRIKLKKIQRHIDWVDKAIDLLEEQLSSDSKNVRRRALAHIKELRAIIDSTRYNILRDIKRKGYARFEE